MKIKATLLLITCIILTGCWGGTEIDKLAIVMGIGVDKGTETDHYLITVQVANAGSFKSFESGGTSPDGAQAYINMKKEGLGLNAPMREIMRTSSRQLFTRSNQVIVIGKDVAEDGLEAILDYFIRSVEGRTTVSLLIADGRAEDILNEKSKLERLPAVHLSALLTTQQQGGTITDTSIVDFLNDTLSLTTAPTVPIAELSLNEDGDPIAEVINTAVFSNYRMLGTLTPAMTRSMLVCRDELTFGMLTVPLDEGYICLDFSGIQTRIIPEYTDGVFSIKVAVSQEATLTETDLKIDLLSSETRLRIEEAASQLCLADLETTLAHAKALSADFLGFGDVLYRHFPREFAPLMADWEVHFRDLQVHFTIDTELSNIGSAIQPILPEGGIH